MFEKRIGILLGVVQIKLSQISVALTLLEITLLHIIFEPSSLIDRYLVPFPYVPDFIGLPVRHVGLPPIQYAYISSDVCLSNEYWLVLSKIYFESFSILILKI